MRRSGGPPRPAVIVAVTPANHSPKNLRTERGPYASPHHRHLLHGLQASSPSVRGKADSVLDFFCFSSFLVYVCDGCAWVLAGGLVNARPDHTSVPNAWAGLTPILCALLMQLTQVTGPPPARAFP